ncbi:MAG: transcription termination/antitermination protein NusG [Clostridia bacterium]|nr:transcription termination/antitermination protein NusG [Clostridia bacterium]
MARNAKWFVVHTYSGYENKVASNIKTVVENRNMQDEILDVCVPTEMVKEIKDGKEKEVERKLFPGYVLVKAETYKKKEKLNGKGGKSSKDGDDFEDFGGSFEEVVSMGDEAWYVIRNTRGVTGFVGPDGKPSPLSESELVALGLAEKEEVVELDDPFGDDDFLDIFSVKVEVKYSVGSTVTVIDGQFTGMNGVVKSIDLVKEEVVVNLPIMNRETPTHFKLHQVELA